MTLSFQIDFYVVVFVKNFDNAVTNYCWGLEIMYFVKLVKLGKIKEMVFILAVGVFDFE